MAYINGTRLDDRIIRSDYDAGFAEGRQYGRGKSGGQVGAVDMAFKKHSSYLSCFTLIKQTKCMQNSL